LDEARDGQIDLSGQAAVIGANAGMRVPRAAAPAAVEDLHVAHATFDEATGGQAKLPEVLRIWLVQAVEPAGRFGFLLKLKRVGDGGLHAGRQLIGANAGAQGRIVWIFNAGQPIEPADEIQLRLLFLARHAGSDEGERIAGADVEADAGELRAQIGGAVRPRAAAAIPGRGAENDVLGKVLIERAQAVVDPRADRRIGSFAWMPAGVPCELGA